MATNDILKGLASAVGGELAKSAAKSASKTTTTTAKKTTAAKSGSAKTTATKSKTVKKADDSKSGGFDLSGISSLLTGAVTSTFTNGFAKGALGFTDVNGDGKIDLKDILQTIVSAVQGGKLDISSLTSAITQVWNAGFKSGQESGKK